MAELLPETARRLMVASGADLIRQIGWEVVRGVVRDVMIGHNLRDSTEALTRKRIAHLNLAIIEMFVRQIAIDPQFPAKLPDLSANVLTQSKVRKAEKWLAQWVLGLTTKAMQNVLHDKVAAIQKYKDTYVETCKRVLVEYESQNGKLQGQLAIGADVKAEIDWLAALYLVNTIGCQTLTIRGSEKSAYGKLFEKLVLGSLLTLLGFTRINGPGEGTDRVFWLSSSDEKRESDATLIHSQGRGVRFDIGFIGRGNSEISLDKVSRFEAEVTHGGEKFFVATVIIVDRIGVKSRIVKLAQVIKGHIIQMSNGLWPLEVARILKETLGHQHPLTDMGHPEALNYITTHLQNVPLETFLEGRFKIAKATDKKPKRKPKE
jgi:hypothetical protein